MTHQCLRDGSVSKTTVIMSNGVLQPGMVMPALAPPPPDPHPNKAVQRMRDAWDMRIIGWDAIWRNVRMRPQMRRGHVIESLSRQASARQVGFTGPGF